MKMVEKNLILLVVLFTSLVIKNIYCEDKEQLCFELLVIDTQGKRTGYDPSNGDIIEEIFESSYGDEIPIDEPIYKWLHIPRPFRGGYTLYVIGKDTGTYEIEINAINDTGDFYVKKISGSITQNEIKKIFINYSPTPGEPTHIFEDNTPPVTEIEVGSPKFEVFGVNYISKSTKICFNSTDPIVAEGASGVKYTEYRIDDSSWVVYTSTFTIFQEGQHIIEYRSVDNANNVEEIKSSLLFVTELPNYALVGTEKINLSGKIDVEGSIRSNDKVYLIGDVVVEGDVYSKDVYITKNSIVTGNVIKDAPKINPYPIDLTQIIDKVIKENDNNKIPLTQKGRKPIDKKGRLVIKDRDTLTLSSGTYYFDGIEITGKSELNTEGCVSIICTGDIKILGKIKVNQGKPSDKFVIFVSTYVSSTKRNFEDIVVEGVFDEDDIKEFEEHRDIENDLELDIDNKGKIHFKPKKTPRPPNIYIWGKTEFNGIIYAPKSKLTMVGINNYVGNIFTDEIFVLGRVNIKNPNSIIVDSVSLQNEVTETNNTNNMMSAKVLEGTPDPTFKLRDVYSYPNPAKQTNPKIHIECGIADKVEIKIYNIVGELIHTKVLVGLPNVIHNNKYAYEYEWDVKDVSSGVYIYYVYAEKSGEEPIKVLKKLAIIR
jgi:cytoskeletal protein CcmA (bactofilin family)